jgi:hypothetical protein
VKIEREGAHGSWSGTGCLEFRPGNNVTRAQLCKIVVMGEGWTLYTPPTPTFRDVPGGDPFYSFIETAYRHGIISGYACGAGCLEFRPGNNATRGADLQDHLSCDYRAVDHAGQATSSFVDW